MKYAVIALALGLGACASTPRSPEIVAVAPSDLVRPRCTPPASLMIDPGPLPLIPAGANMVETSIKDTLRYNEMRRQLLNLIAAVQRCQQDL